MLATESSVIATMNMHSSTKNYPGIIETLVHSIAILKFKQVLLKLPFSYSLQCLYRPVLSDYAIWCYMFTWHTKECQQVASKAKKKKTLMF